MNNKKDLPLESELRRQADELQPAFSQPLHDRIMRSVRVARAQHGAAQPKPARFPWFVVMSSAVALILFAITWVMLADYFKSVAAPAPVVAKANPMQEAYSALLASADPIRRQIDLPLRTTQDTYDALQHDASTLANFVINQLPTLEPRKIQPRGM